MDAWPLVQSQSISPFWWAPMHCLACAVGCALVFDFRTPFIFLVCNRFAKLFISYKGILIIIIFGIYPRCQIDEMQRYVQEMHNDKT